MKHAVRPVHYDSAPNAGFQRDLKRRVADYLATQPNGRRATPFMWMKVALFIGAWWATWASLALVPHSIPVSFGWIVVFSLLSVALAYNVSHDAVHMALSRRPWVNELLFQLTFNPLGPNAMLWRLRHRVMHHMCVNVPGLDYNIEAAGILRFSPTQPWRPIHRWQHVYAPLAYCVFTLHWVFVKDFEMLRERRVGNVDYLDRSARDTVGFLLWKLQYVMFMLVIPTLVLPWGFLPVLAGFLLYQALTSFLFVITFTGSHLNQGLLFVEPEGGDRVPHSFLEHALHTSLDFHPRDPAVSFFLGGFNAHVAHHMFPQICSVHYPEITRIIQETSAEHGLPYKELDAISLFRSHFRYLADLGRDPTSSRAAYLLGGPP